MLRLSPEITLPPALADIAEVLAANLPEGLPELVVDSLALSVSANGDSHFHSTMTLSQNHIMVLAGVPFLVRPYFTATALGARVELDIKIVEGRYTLESTFTLSLLGLSLRTVLAINAESTALIATVDPLVIAGLQIGKTETVADIVTVLLGTISVSPPQGNYLASQQPH